MLTGSLPKTSQAKSGSGTSQGPFPMSSFSCLCNFLLESTGMSSRILVTGPIPPTIWWQSLCVAPLSVKCYAKLSGYVFFKYGVRTLKKSFHVHTCQCFPICWPLKSFQGYTETKCRYETKPTDNKITFLRHFHVPSMVSQ